MAKKSKTIQDDMKDSARKIWLAGLGAMSVAEEEGSKLFKKLVERGSEIESSGKDQVKDQVKKAKGKVESTWEDWQETFDENITKALHRLGVPSRDEIKNLTTRVEQLSSKIEKIKPKAEPAATKSETATAAKKA
jgi:poly(hydroxyalkanoate) granule-associated protein